MRVAAAGAFRALRVRNYRIWAAGTLASNVGTWMQRTAQDWLVLTVLTHRSATAVGIVTALQFGPQIFLLPLTGWAADRLDRRRLLMATQLAMGMLALGLGLLTVTGVVRLWQVYAFGLALGCVGAFDTPARQIFVSDMVGPHAVANAVALNATSFSLARTVGPALAGLVIAAVGCGWLFLINAASYCVVLASLGMLRVQELHAARAYTSQSGLADGVRYVWQRPDLLVVLAMLTLVGTMSLNSPVYISVMAASVFHVGADAYGGLTSSMAVGSVTGALLAARRQHMGVAVLAQGAAVLGSGLALAAAMPGVWAFAAVLVVVGAAAQTVTTSSIAFVQMATDPAMRGRVMALLLAVAMGGLAAGSPCVGWAANHFGAR